MDEASLGPPFLTPPAQRFLDDDAAYKRLLSTPALSEIDLTQVLFVLFVGWIVVVCVWCARWRAPAALPSLSHTHTEKK